MFRQVAAALPGMDQSDQVEKNGIFLCQILLILVLLLKLAKRLYW